MDNKHTVVDKLLCMACLCVGRTLQKVTDERMKRFYLDALNEIPLCDMPQVCPSICWECEALLRKVVSFKEQIMDSYRILQTYTNENLYECLLTDISRPPRLIVRVNSPVNVIPDCEQKPDVQKDLQLTVYVKDEVKIDWDDDRDDLDITPAELEDPVVDEPKEINTMKNKIVKKRKKKVRKTSLKKTKSQKQKSDGKIITIELSYEEMLAERERDATRDNYVKAQYKCTTCIIGYNYIKSYEAHMTNKHSSYLGEYSCPICKTVISSVDSFTAHYKRHMRRYECSICHKRTLDMKVMQQHYYSTHEITLKQYKCNVCGKISNSIDSHRYHKDTHKARVQCPECDKNFSHRAGLMNHRLAVHELQNAFPCTVCEKVFRWKASLKRHMEKHHVKDKMASAAYCAACGISFSSVCSYQRHMKNSLKHVTQEQLRFICDHCNKRFADKTKLRDHIEEKHLHRTYQCHICNKPSKNRVGLDQHIRNVHRGRPNNKMCHHCGKGFPTKVQLESHIRTHTGERPFICEFCPTTFSQQSNLYKHNRQVHLNIKSKRYPLCKKTKPEEHKPPAPALEDFRPVAVLHFEHERGFL
ncbi:zinc finger protein 883-like [Leguminivora glycinivorella]|uniref:zinc finger protein 883-like n=1 Tax=Leguminivora glycinivorella TaxID=1035111 RepID=UPI00200CF8B8|nr:zinc finger protein 883-like [Leguminivora glycinivorella]